MEKYPLWKPILLVAVIAIFSMTLASYPLKPGRDLAGGTTLVYQVTVPESSDAKSVVEEVINAIKRRIDPQGLKNLVFVPQAGNRIEIQLPAVSIEAQDREQDYVNAKLALTEQNVQRSELTSAIAMDAGARAAELESLAGDAEALATYQAAAAAFDQVAVTRSQYEAAAEARKARQSELRDLAADADERQTLQLRITAATEIWQDALQAYSRAEKQYSVSVEAALATNITTEEIDRLMALPDKAPAGADATDPNVKTVRESAIEAFIASHASRADAIRAAVDAFRVLEELKGGSTDPDEVIRTLRGSGVLEFRIAAGEEPGADAVAQYRAQLQEKGPRSGARDPYRWFLVDAEASFADTEEAKAALKENPIAFFAGHNLHGAEFASDYYVLLSNTPDKALMASMPGWEVSRASQSVDDIGRAAVGFTLNAPGGQLMSALSRANLQKPMAIVLDGRVISAPTLQGAIASRGVITGQFTNSEVRYLINTLNAGALAGALSEEPISRVETGPELGLDNLKHGKTAAMLSLAFVALFMVVYYFFGGIVAVLALLANMVIILGTMALLRATFTLPGIAGIVLTIGMAVDANVLIIERIREELARGAELRAAVRLGYEKAFSTIIDANITTLITCLVLYYTATTEIKGFALTLMIGIFATLFTTLFGTRILMDLYVRTTSAKTLHMLPISIKGLGRVLTPKVNWAGKAPIFFGVSIVMVIASLLVVSSRGSDLLDIEFRSGTQVQITLANDQMIERRDAVDRLAALAQERPEFEALGPGTSGVVAVGTLQDGFKSNSFQIEALDEDADHVSRGVQLAFEGLLATRPPLSFDGDGAKDRREAPLFPILKSALKENIAGYDENLEDVSDYLGGVAIVLNNLTPPASVEDITDRIRTMRLQPDFQELTFRKWEVLGLDTADAQGADDERLYDAVALVSIETGDVGVSYLEDARAMDDPTGLAWTEFNVLRAAVQRDTLDSVVSFSSQVSSSMAYQAIQAMVLSLFAVVAYIWIRFGSIRYGLAAIAALAHDVTIAMGLLAFSHYLFNNALGSMFVLSDFKIDLAIVAAMLTIVGYSLNDTIVVFDRVRENRGRLATASKDIVNDSINQTISRTTITSLTTLLAVAVLYFNGGDGVHGFAFAMLIGVLVGTYSSVAIAAPILLMGSGKGGLKEKLAETAADGDDGAKPASDVAPA